MKQRSRKEKFIRMMKRDAALHLMLLLPVTMLLIFHYIPLFGIVIAFQNYNPARGFSNSPFVGLNNFKELFLTPGFVQALKNTVIIALGKIVLGIIVPVTVALLLNEMRKARVKKTIQTMIYLPHFISWVLMAGIIIEILNPRSGMLNQFLGLFGIDPIFFLGSNKLFREIVWVTDVWKEFGYATIIYMAALTSIDPSLYEAASLDGAGYFKKMLHITLPGISMTIVLLMTLKMGSILNAGFDQIFNLYSTITYESGDIIDTLVYRLGLGGGRFSLASAAGLFKSVISGTLLVLSYKVAHKTSGYRVF
ncbi:MAG: protein lplB [Herbinix sp.]|jgi:putative aldouronate transport system permease protein|nr:protein lplB [Herbinix sp.]MDF2907723.1 protein lplB [Herbinix sp.]